MTERESGNTRSYTPLEIDRICQLDRLWENFSALSRRYSKQGKFWVTKQNMDGNPYSVIITPDFLFSMYKIRKSLMVDLINMGLKDDVADISNKYLRQGNT